MKRTEGNGQPEGAPPLNAEYLNIKHGTGQGRRRVGAAKDGSVKLFIVVSIVILQRRNPCL